MSLYQWKIQVEILEMMYEFVKATDMKSVVPKLKDLCFCEIGELVSNSAFDLLPLPMQVIKDLKNFHDVQPNWWEEIYDDELTNLFYK